MAVKTKIQWTDTTVNPSTGCDCCELWKRGVREDCYAGKITDRFGSSNPGLADDFDFVTEMPGRLQQTAKLKALKNVPRSDKPWLDGLPRLVFVGDMGDSFSEDVSFEFLEGEVIDVVSAGRGLDHQWQWLTKRPGRMAEFSTWLAKRGKPWPENLWAGTTITTQNSVSRLRSLLKVGDHLTLRFLSIEPQWEAIDFGDDLQEIDWVIQGGMSGTTEFPFNIDWARQLRDDCRKYRVPYFLKQLGKHVVQDGQRLTLCDGHGGDWSEWPQDLRIRQMPIYTGRRRLRSVNQRKC